MNMSIEGKVKSRHEKGITYVTFFHPKSNSLPSFMLEELISEIEKAGKDENTHVVILESEGDGAFCAGASFDELIQINDFETGQKFFNRFGNLILAIKNCPKFVIARVHGSIVGGGVGLVAACDYSFALKNAGIKLSELNLGIGAFVIGPVVERKIGKAAFSDMSIDCAWRSSEWAKNKGLFSSVYETIEELDKSLSKLAQSLDSHSPEAMKKLKEVFWDDLPGLETILKNRADISGNLVLSKYTKDYIDSFKK